MIVKWLVDLVSSVLGTLMSGVAALVPDVPSWVPTGLTKVGDVYEHASEFSAWIPVGLAVTIVLWLLAAQVIVIGMKLVRVAVSYVTLGGGAVAP